METEKELVFCFDCMAWKPWKHKRVSPGLYWRAKRLTAKPFDCCVALLTRLANLIYGPRVSNPPPAPWPPPDGYEWNKGTCAWKTEKD